mgnify:CR=1 FL=1
MDNKNITKEDAIIKELLSGTKMKAGENLKFRIMQQIETEAALSRKQKVSAQPVSVLKNMLSIFGVMYALIALVAVGTFLIGGKEALESITFFTPVIMIASVCGIFWMISAYDDRRRSKYKAKG